MSCCEQFEMQISAFIDKELSAKETKPLIDHLLTCQSCQLFYQEANSLQNLTEDMALATSLAKAPPSPPKRSLVRLALPVGRLAWGAAAAIVLALGLTATNIIPDPTGLFGTDVAVAQTITLGEDSGKMTDGRFVELTTELLKADQNYQHMMYQLLDQVQRSEYIDEQSQLISSSGEMSSDLIEQEDTIDLSSAIY